MNECAYKEGVLGLDPGNENQEGIYYYSCGEEHSHQLLLLLRSCYILAPTYTFAFQVSREKFKGQDAAVKGLAASKIMG